MKVIMQLYKLILRINLIIALMLFLSSGARAKLDVNWEVTGKNYKWTITSVDVVNNADTIYDCGNILTGNMCEIQFVFGLGPEGLGGLLLSKDIVNVRGKKS